MKKLPPVIWFAARLFLGLVFAYSGFSKLMEPMENFRGSIAQYEIIPYAVTPVIATIFPWIEFILGVFLILGFTLRPSALALGLFSMMFLIILGSSDLLLGKGGASCGCFGANGLIRLSVRQVFLLDIFDLFLGFKLFSIKEHPWSLDAWLRHLDTPKRS